MANLIIQENGVERTTPAVHGEELTIIAPCDCSAVEGVQINGVAFPFYDTLGNVLSSKLFAEGSLIRVMIDVTNNRALILNSGTRPKQTIITFTAAGWVEGDDIFTQVVTVDGGTAKSLVALQPTSAQIVAMVDEGVIALTVDNNSGVFTATAIGSAPPIDMTIQATLTEVIV